MITPSDTQKRVRDHESLALLLVAPAGCGKTESLAMRIAGLIDGRHVSAPRRVLATTFTNRAKDNLRSRLSDHIPAARMRDHVTVSNFHGLAARIIRAHGDIVGVDPAISLPENDWVGEQLRQLGVQYKAKDAVLDILRTTKQQALTDDQVAAALDAHGNQTAIALEKQRIAENRATYDDLLRYAELILANDAVADLYRNHFGAVVVDEYQDLTPQQLRMLTRIGEGRITFAGDVAQGIYGFAGANPAEIDAAVRAVADDIIEFNESHRSSPAVLDLVNSLNPITGGQDLQCADPASWPNNGVAALATYVSADTEAASITRLVQFILDRAPNHRIGVISRVKSRLRFIDRVIEATGLPLHRWEDGVLDTDTAKLVRALLRRLDTVELATVNDKLTYLRNLAVFDRIEEPDTRKALADALGWVLDRLNEGLTPTQVTARIRVGDQTTLLNAPGVHLLSGHVGKGQQFDWVVVVGAEDGNIPFFLAESDAEKLEEARILSVMLSRARHGAFVTYARNVPTVAGAPRDRARSPLWAWLQTGGALTGSAIKAWLDGADWDAVAKR